MAPADVRLVREFEGQRGTLWREYAHQDGRRIIVQAKSPGARRAASSKDTARIASRRLKGCPA
jgi:hypothetical protein